MIQARNSAPEHGTPAFILLLGVLHSLGAWSNDLFAPSLPLAADGLGAGHGQVQFTMTATLFGLAVGQSFHGPLSDRFGRLSVLCAGLAIFSLAGALCASAGSLGELAAGRFLQGLGAAVGMVLSRALILDRWAGEEASRMLSSVTVVVFLSPVAAPLLGGYLASLGHWPTVFWLQGALGVALLLGALSILSDTRGSRPDVTVASRFLAYGPVLRDREVLLAMGCIGLGHAGLLAFVTNSAFVFVTYLGLEPAEFGICFSLAMLGGVAGSLLNRRLVLKLGMLRLLSVGSVTIALSGIAAVILNVAVGGLWSTLLPSICYMFGMSIILSNAVARIVSRFRHVAGAASAVLGVNQLLFGAVAAAVLSLNEVPGALPLATALAVGGVGSSVLWRFWSRSIRSRERGAGAGTA